MSLLRAGLVWCLLLASPASAADPARLENVKTEWQNVYGVIIYTILADVKNVSATPLQYVKVHVVLADKNGTVVAERDGYNMRAESLGDEAAPEHIREKLAHVQAIPAGGTDHFRLSFDKSDIGKPFRTARVSIAETR